MNTTPPLVLWLFLQRENVQKLEKGVVRRAQPSWSVLCQHIPEIWLKKKPSESTTHFLFSSEDTEGGFLCVGDRVHLSTDLGCLRGLWHLSSIRLQLRWARWPSSGGSAESQHIHDGKMLWPRFYCWFVLKLKFPRPNFIARTAHVWIFVRASAGADVTLRLISY